MKWLRWFLAGALAVPLAHHVALYFFYRAGIAPYRPWSLDPTKPFGVPQVVSLAFWGGVWGLLLGAVLQRVRSSRAWWVAAAIFGAIAPTLVAVFVVMPLKGQHFKPSAALALMALTVNGAWGLGAAVLYRLFGASRRS